MLFLNHVEVCPKADELLAAIRGESFALKAKARTDSRIRRRGGVIRVRTGEARPVS